MRTPQAKVLAPLLLAFLVGTSFVIADERKATHSLENTRTEGNRSLVRATVDGKEGAAWLDTSLVGRSSTFEQDRLQTLLELEKLAKAGDTKAIRGLAVSTLRRFGPQEELVLLLARQLRIDHSYESSWLLYDAVIDRAELEKRVPDLELLQACAEVAVLDGDRTRARRAIRALRRHYGRMVDALADSLETQLDGGKSVVFAVEMPTSHDTEALKQERGNIDPGVGDVYLSTRIADKALTSLRKENLPGNAAKAIYVRTDAKPAIIKAYNEGGPQSGLTNNTGRLQMYIAVDQETWEGMADWMKKERMAQAVFFGRRYFTKSEVVLSINAYRSEHEGLKAFGAVLGTLTTYRLSPVLDFDLRTKAKSDASKESAVLKDLKDFEDRRTKGR